jgi:hypothetical protein
MSAAAALSTTTTDSSLLGKELHSNDVDQALLSNQRRNAMVDIREAFNGGGQEDFYSYAQ